MTQNVDVIDHLGRRANTVAISFALLFAITAYLLTRVFQWMLPELTSALPMLLILTLLCALISAFLLSVRARVMGEEHLAWIGAAMGVTALGLLLLILGSPSYASDGGPFSTTPGGAVWISVISHVTVPLFAILAVWGPRNARLLRAALVATACGITIYASLSASALPALVDTNMRYSPLLVALLAAAAFLNTVATAAWVAAHGRKPSWSEAWITAALALTTAGVLLQTLAGERLSVLWWASLWTHVGQHVVLATGLLMGLIAVFHTLKRYSRSLSTRLDEQLLQAREDQAIVNARVNRIEARERVRRTIDSGNLYSVYQPIVDLRSGHVVGVEALTRFPSDPQRPPNAMFQDAARVDLGTELELASVRAAIASMDELPTEIYLSVNVSPEAFASSELLRLLSDFPQSHRLVLELTEHAQVQDYGPIRETLTRFRALGVRLAIDDMGAGFSNLRHVVRLDPDLVKLDVELTKGLATDPVSQTMVTSIVSFGKETGTSIIAEGIENNQTLALLRDLGVDSGQGYLFSAPTPLPLPEVANALGPAQQPGPEPSANSNGLGRSSPERGKRTDRTLESPLANKASKLLTGLGVGGVAIIILYTLIIFGSGIWGQLAAAVLFALIASLAALLCFWATRNVSLRSAPEWYFLGGACTAWVAGVLLRSYYEFGLGIEAPHPSLADVGFLAFYPLAFVSLVLMIRKRLDDTSLVEVLLDSFIVLVLVGVITIQFYLEPALGTNPLRSIEAIASATWAVGTVGLVFLTIVALTVTRNRFQTRHLPTLLVAFLLFAIGNVVYARLVLEGAYNTGSLLDITWMSGFLVLGAASVVAVMDDARPEKAWGSDTVRTRPVLNGFLPGVSVFGLTSIAALSSLSDGSNWHIVLAALVAGTTLTFRIWYGASMREWRDHRSRERNRLGMLLDVSEEIAMATRVDTLLSKLSNLIAADMNGGRVMIRLFDADGSRVEQSAHSEVAGSEQTILKRLATTPIGVLPGERQVIDTAEPIIQRTDDPSLPAELRGLLTAAGKHQMLIVPIVARHDVLGVIEFWTIDGRDVLNEVDVTALAVIGQVAGVAIRNARLVSELQWHAAYDTLTGVMNHRTSIDSLSAQLRQRPEFGEPISIFVIDLDNFKAINDTLGHQAGDRVLASVGAMLRRELPANCLAGRLGGDEFLCILPGHDTFNANSVRDHLASTVAAQQIELGEQLVTFRLSIGLATSPADGDTPEALIGRADERMYAQKRRSKSRLA